MSKILTKLAHFSRISARTSAGVVRRTACYFESQQQWLFAWLHQLDHPSHLRHGVVICPPLGYEQIHSHRSLRHLADSLAQAGFTVLRFDYHGTADSAGSEEDGQRYPTWIANIHDAKHWLEQHMGCEQISLLGVRLGAALAAQAAVSTPVAGLVLWAPVIKGRSYVREMKALSLTASDTSTAAVKSADMEAAGFVLTEQTSQDLSRLDLLHCQPLCRRALLIQRDDAPADSRLLEHFQSLGIDAEQTVSPGFAAMMAEPHFTKVPRQALNSISVWMQKGLPDTSSRAGDLEKEACRLPEEGKPAALTTCCTFLAQAHICERVLPINRQPELFGIISEPRIPAAEQLPWIVFINAGAAYRVGPNRLHVQLCRLLASRGFRCLRMDLHGLGDSVCADPEHENDPYPATALGNIELAFSKLQASFQAERFVLAGLCSGAYAAFHAAAQLRHAALVASLLINPLTFYWRTGMSLSDSTVEQLQSYQACLQSAWQPAKWLKLLTGRSKLGFSGVLKLLRTRWRLPALFGASVSDSAASDAALQFHPLREDLPGDMERIAQAGRQLTCVFARSDPGYTLLKLGAGRKVKELQRAGKLDLYFLEGDHTFSRREPRRMLAETIAEHLCRRYSQPAESCRVPSQPQQL